MLKIYVAHKRPMNDLRSNTTLPHTVPTAMGDAAIAVCPPGMAVSYVDGIGFIQ